MYTLSLPKDAGPLAPKHIGRLVAEGLAATLPGDWKVTADGVRSVEGRQVTDIVLQRLRASRADSLWISPRLVVRDAGLEGWLASNTNFADFALDGRIFNSLLINFTTINDVFVSQTQLEPLSASYDEFLAVLIGSVLPTRELMRVPDTLLDLPDRWLWDVQGMLLWSVSAGRADLCWQLVDRSLGPVDVRRAAFTRGLRQQERGEGYNRSNSFDSLGYLVGRIGAAFELGLAPHWLDVE